MVSPMNGVRGRGDGHPLSARSWVVVKGLAELSSETPPRTSNFAFVRQDHPQLACCCYRRSHDANPGRDHEKPNDKKRKNLAYIDIEGPRIENGLEPACGAYG